MLSELCFRSTSQEIKDMFCCRRGVSAFNLFHCDGAKICFGRGSVRFHSVMLLDVLIRWHSRMRRIYNVTKDMHVACR